MHSGAKGVLGSTRLLAVCVVLLGLFLMHGSPASAAGGCHGAMAMGSSMPVGPVGPTGATAHRAGQDAPGGAGAATARGTCLSTPAHEQVALPAPGLLAPGAVALPAAAVAAGPQPATGSRRRGPPTGGRARLLEVCGART